MKVRRCTCALLIMLGSLVAGGGEFTWCHQISMTCIGRISVISTCTCVTSITWILIQMSNDFMSEGSSQHSHCLKHSFWTILSCLKMPSPGGPGTGNRPRIRWRAGKLIVPQAEPEAKRAKIEQEVVAFDEVPCWSTKTAKKQDEEPTKKSDSEGTQKEPKTAKKQDEEPTK